VRRAVFLDRDGVLNEPVVRAGKPYAPATLQDFRIYPEAPAACQRLRDAGYLLIVVTNQPDVARGTQRQEVIEGLHTALRAAVPLDDVLCCLHDDADRCACRKPAPGLLIIGARQWNVDLGASVMVGDRWRDVEAGRSAGCATVFIDRGYDEALRGPPTVTVHSIAEAADAILDGRLAAGSASPLTRA
jgi:D-glycero-D-manno-heptose 1,7-bisphosphate phosphatase